MSREDVRIEGYEPGSGFQPAVLGMSRRDVYLALLLVANLVVSKLLESYLGSRATLAFVGAAAVGAVFLAAGIRQILNPEQWEKGKTEKGARRFRIESIVAVMFGTAVMTLAMGSLVFLAEGGTSRWIMLPLGFLIAVGYFATAYRCSRISEESED